MEAFGAFSNGEWDSFSSIFSSHELDITPHCLEQCSFLIDQHNAAIDFPTELEENNGGSMVGKGNNGWFYSLDAFDPNLQYIKQDMSSSSCSAETDSSGSVLFANQSNVHENYCCSSDLLMSVDHEKNFGSFFPHILMEGGGVCVDGIENAAAFAMAGRQLPLKRKQDVPESQIEVGEGEFISNNADFADNQKKKTRVSGEVQKNKKTQQSKKKQKLASKTSTIEDQEGTDGQSSISESLEDDNASPDTQDGSADNSDQLKESTPGLNGKSRASRGSATDPQSLYARKRRERINERLRILQKLVPNGTKVDISTMLEEAVHYVNFLQLQIKLLSSDEMWMYAPLAYNGMDIGLHQKLSPFL